MEREYEYAIVFESGDYIEKLNELAKEGYRVAFIATGNHTFTLLERVKRVTVPEPECMCELGKSYCYYDHSKDIETEECTCGKSIYTCHAKKHGTERS